MCILCAAHSGDNNFCDACWKKMSVFDKQRYWELTNYGAYKVLTDEQIAEFVKGRAR